FGPITTSAGSAVSLGQLGPHQVYLSALAAQGLNARAGDRLQIFARGRPENVTIRAVVSNEYLAGGGLRSGGNSTDPVILAPIQRIQRWIDHPSQITHVLISNRGDALSGAALTAQADRRLGAARLGYLYTNVKQDALDQADRAGTGFTAGFITFGLFSIAAGVMLIFLIFVMLAAERRAEMGMARAVGTKRRHLIQQFLFEGYVYDLGAALVGVVFGILLGLGMVSVLAVLARNTGFFQLQRHIEPRSVVVAFCLGALVTFATVLASCWRASRLNIVAAIRDLPDDLSKDASIGAAFTRPWKDLKHAARSARTKHPLGALAALVAAPWHLFTAFRVFISRGPVLLLAGAFFLNLGISTKQLFPFSLGASLLLVGAAMLLRWLLGGLHVPGRIRNRLGYSLAGVSLVVYWLLPFDFFRSDLQFGIEMFVLSGIMLTLGGVWTVMYNIDLLLGGLMLVLGGVGRLTPILKTAVTYPTQQRFRTGMTLFMFSLVMFALMVQAVFIASYGGRALDLNSDAGGYNLYGGASSHITDLAAKIRSNPSLRARFDGTGSTAQIPVAIRQQYNPASTMYLANIADTGFLTSTHFSLHSRAIGYGSDQQVWQALRVHPGYVVVNADLLRSASGSVSGSSQSVSLRGLTYGDRTFKPVRMQITDHRNGDVIPLTVIGVLARSAGFFDRFYGIYLSQATLRAAHDPIPVPNSYFFRVAPGQDVHQVALALGSAFLQNGLDLTDVQQEYNNQIGLQIGFNNLLEVFMALGLVVGIAALGVIATRSVVERRQQIGMLRAIGFKQRMVLATFLLESSFVAILGTGVGMVLGLLLGHQVVNYFGKTDPGLQFVIPWGEVGLIVLGAYLASLLTTYLPAWQASRIYPAEALRYE
ncbi:MAG: ABC transporter permease, partial [Chloroflexota bacterium]|nr:ABC transporter permease [Chloroflexota bacterium]